MPYTFRRSDIPKLDLDVDRGASFKAWLEEWAAYSAVSQLGKEDSDTQYNVLRLAFTRDTANVVDNLGLIAEDKKKVTKIIEALTKHMEGAINETVERRNFRKRRQHARESFDDYLVALRELVKTCRYCTDDCVSKILRDQIIEGLQDGDTIEELLRQKKLSLEQTIQICRAHESAKNQREEIKGSRAALNVTSAYKAKKKSTNRDRPMAARKQLTHEQQRTCGRCGSAHGNLPQNCPAFNKTCNKCHKLGHFASLCRTKNLRMNELRQPNQDTSTTKQLFAIYAMQGVERTPTVDVLVQGPNGFKNLTVLPDSGADITAADVKTLQQIGEDVNNLLPSRNKPAFSVDGSALHSLGQMTVTITLGDVTTEEALHVFPSIPGGMLMSWKAAQNLQILPKNYPEQIRSVQDSPVPSNKITAENLIQEFPTVFDGKIRVMDGEKFRIQLNDNAKPFCVSAPRTIPYAYRDKVKLELDALQSQGIIEPVTEPTDWCSPIVVAPKKNSDNIRLCVDYSKLNKFVKRELYSSCTPSDAVADISSQNSAFFTVFDALKGYHQCPLDQESQLLTCFMTPFGRFKFLRAPFGICSISEHYNRRLDEAFQGLKNYRRIVDDVVIFDNKETDHLAHVRQFLKRCSDKGISLHKEKFKFCEREITFAGFQLSREGYKVDDSLLNAIRDFPLPTNVTDLRSFFGLANQLSSNTATIAQCLQPLRPLLSTKK